MMMPEFTAEEFDTYIAEEQLLQVPEFKPALVGVLQGGGYPCVVYDIQKCIQILIADSGEDYEFCADDLFRNFVHIYGNGVPRFIEVRPAEVTNG
jgi:hypothetical protein